MTGDINPYTHPLKIVAWLVFVFWLFFLLGWVA